MHSLAQTVLAYITKHKLLKPGNRVGVALSGGADSVALFRLLLDLRGELGVVLSVVHFNHQLRGPESDDDQRFVADLASHHNLELHFGSGNVRSQAAAHAWSLETAARNLRYQFFRDLLKKNTLDRVATAHTVDDQAETVILRLVRGAGSRGMAGIYPRLSIPVSEPSEHGTHWDCAIVRPLLSTRRKDLEAYLGRIEQPWREDASNRDLRHARNRVRHGILPTLERDLNPSVREVLAENAEIARAEQDYWDQQVHRLLGELWKKNAKTGGGTIKVSALSVLPLALQRRVVRGAAESLGLRLEFRHVEEIVDVAFSKSASAVLPKGWTASLHRGDLGFAATAGSHQPPVYEHYLPLPGTVQIPQLGSRFEALLVPRKSCELYNHDHLLDPAQLGNNLIVRNWRPGDRFWPAHRKEPKKVKELLQELHLIGLERKLWPVVVSGTDLVWVRGFPAASQFRVDKSTAEAVLVREVAMQVQND